jgi:hypothetical protein
MINTIRPFENGSIEVSREQTVEVEGETFSRPIHYVLVPDHNLNPRPLEEEPEEIQLFCAAWWTPERVAAWQASVAAPIEEV